AAVYRLGGTVDLDQRGDNAAQRVGDGRKPGRDIAGVADDDHVGEQPLLVFTEEGAEVARANLLLALDEHLDVEWQFPRRLQVRRDRPELGDDGPLVVCGATAV